MFQQWKESFIVFLKKTAHTNMAKAALNMLTHTAWDFSKRWNMNAVDTGWVTDEDPAELAKRNRIWKIFNHL
jgi:hypothetical protein